MNEDTLKKVMDKMLNAMKEEIKEAIEKSSEELKKEIGNINVRLDKIEQENQEAWEEIDDLKSENENLKERMQQMEDYSRRDNVIINGIKEDENETEEELTEKVKELGLSLGLEIESYDIHACHRLPTNRKEDTPAVILKLNNRNKRSKLIRRSKDVKIEGVYVSPHLSKKTAEIHKEARRGMKEALWQFAWVNDNQQVFIRRNEKTATVKITTKQQLFELAERFKKETSNIQTRSASDKNTKITITDSSKRVKMNKNQQSTGIKSKLNN